MTQALANEASRRIRAKALREIGPQAFRIEGGTQLPDIAAWADEHRVDHAWRAEGARFADLRLVAMDMDSTLITIECIDELGDIAGKKAEIAGITERAMRGELDFPQALRHRVGLLAGLPEAALVRVYEERLKLMDGAETLLAKCKAHGVKLLLVSGGFTFFTERLKARLALDYTISNTLEVRDGKLTGEVLGPIVDAQAKADKFVAVMRELGAVKHETVAVGDGANDLKMMAQAGTSVAFHAKPVVRAQASCSLNWSGLDGVVNLFE